MLGEMQIHISAPSSRTVCVKQAVDPFCGLQPVTLVPLQPSSCFSMKSDNLRFAIRFPPVCIVLRAEDEHGSLAEVHFRILFESL